MSTAKDELVRLIKEQPDDSSPDEIVRKARISRHDRAWPRRRRCGTRGFERRNAATHPFVAKVVWTAEAERWLSSIFEYIAAENRPADTVQGIYDRAQPLCQFPQLGYRYRASVRNVRILLYGHYRIAYLVGDDGDIRVLGVFHGALDISKYQL